MKRERRFIAVVSVAFVLVSILCGTAQAGSLGFGRDETSRAEAGPSAGFVDQVSAWLLGTWTGLKTALVEAVTLPPSVPSKVTLPPAVPLGDCEAGWGLDPEGCPRPDSL